MKKFSFIFRILLIVFTTACSNEEEHVLSSENPTSQRTELVTFSQETDNVSVLIFGKNENNDFVFKRSINSGWTNENTVSTYLELGDYKFLFIKSAGITTSFSPVLQENVSSFDSFSIVPATDNLNAGYVLPVDEIWLPEDADTANKIYEIRDSTRIKNKLKRIVSQVILNVNRGYVHNGNFISMPFSSNNDITDFIGEVKFDITGVGEKATIEGSSGYSKTLFKTDSAKDITEEGFATYEGPFIFPPDAGKESNIEITLIPKAGSLLTEMKKTVSGFTEKNKQLIITLWLTDSYNLFNITIDTAPITDSEEGDKGIWE